MTPFAAVHSAAHFPLVGGGLDQHHAGGGAALADDFLGRPDAAAAGGEEIRPHALAGDVLARGREFVTDLRPLAFEFFGNHLAQAREGALPHLGARHPNHDGFIRLDHDPGIDLGTGHLGFGFAGKWNVKAERKPGDAGSDQEGAAIHVGHVIHRRLPQAFAASWIAVRTC